MTVEGLVDAFVEKINSGPRERESLDDVPTFLREPSHDLRTTSWRIVRTDNSHRIEDLQNRIARRFPPSFLYFVSNYSFPAFEVNSLMFFANTGENIYWELAGALFRDPHMSPQLLRAGFIQIGNPMFYDYDPICFDCNRGDRECRIVQLDHEAILQSGRVEIVKEIAPSFVAFSKAAVASTAQDRQDNLLRVFVTSWFTRARRFGSVSSASSVVESLGAIRIV